MLYINVFFFSALATPPSSPLPAPLAGVVEEEEVNVAAAQGEEDAQAMEALLAWMEAPGGGNPFAEELAAAIPPQAGGGLLDQQAAMAVDIPEEEGDAPPLHLPEHYEVIQNTQQAFPNFGYTSRKLIIKSHGPPALFLQEVLGLLLAQCANTDRVALTVASEVNPMQVIHMPFTPPSQLTVERVLVRIDEMQTSGGLEKDFLLHPIRLTFHRVVMPPPAPVPQGEGRPKKRGMTPRDVLNKNKRSIVQIKNNDTICLARALVVALAYHARDQTPEDKSLIAKAKNLVIRDSAQRRAAQELMASAGVTIPECPTALVKFQTYLTGYRIIVLETRGDLAYLLFDGKPGDSESELPRLYLECENNHFDVIIKLNAAFGFSYFCEACLKGFNRQGVHKCEAYCLGCFASPACPRPKSLTTCPDCARLFNGPACMDRHKVSTSVGNSICSQVFICKLCSKSVDKRRRGPNNPHQCGEVYCQACKKHVPAGHLCYMQPLKRVEYRKAPDTLTRETTSHPPPAKRAKVSGAKKGNVLFIFYDLETVQHTTHDTLAGGNLHVPILCVSQKACLDCVDKELDTCATCGDREAIFKGTQCIQHFMDYVQTFHTYEKVYCLAHNAKSYDAQFLLKYMIEDRKWAPSVLESGTKIMHISLFNGKLIFLDSLNFIPLPLSQFSKAFGLGEASLKGDFPHFLLNVVENSFEPSHFPEGPNGNYTSLHLPPVEAYGADLKGEGERASFLRWHEAHHKQDFDLARDIVPYCQQDVSILRRGCLVYRDIFLQNAQIDPFQSSITIASTCLNIFRTMFLPQIPNQIAVLPAGNRYRLKDRQSKTAFTYLAWVERQLGRRLESALHGSEKRIAGLKVDGYDPETNTAYQFQGCFFHACSKCFPARSSPYFGDPSETFAARYESTMRKVAQIRATGCTVIEMWECDFHQLAARDVGLRQFLTTFRLGESLVPLDPRDAFFGGRTEALKLYHRCGKDETASYQDFTSLYPWCNKYGKYAIGHPRIFLGEDPKIPEQEAWEGLIKCSVLAPRGLYLPLLPYRLDGKLFFPLCHTCVTQRKDEECHHSDEERVLHGTWVTDEIKKAVQLGYTIVKVHELWQYETVQYDPLTMTGGLFAAYVNMFLRLKQEASGWPEDVETEEQKLAYLEEYWVKEGIRLNRENIRFNPGLRQIAKLALNSFWGKFGQRPDLSKTEIINDPDRFFKLLSDPNVEVSSCSPVSDTLMVVKWRYLAEVDIMQPAANVIVAAYTTCNARLKLYSVLEQIGSRALYMDTDSIIYRCLPGEKVLETGNFLGDLTDEIAGYGTGAYISEYASGGPKNYGYRVTVPGSDTTREAFKVKGIRLNHANSAIVNLDRLKDMLGVDSNVPGPAVHVTEPYTIRRLRDHTVISKPQSKIYRVVFDKRRRVDAFDSLPWGY